MARHGIHRSYVMQYDLKPVPHRFLRGIRSDVVASLNTHDMPPFAAYWDGLDIRDRQELGLLDEEGARREWADRQTVKETLARFLRERGWLMGHTTKRSVLKASLDYLSASPARTVLVSLEDLWLERKAQNVPGTYSERPNWRRKARYSLQTVRRKPEVTQVLRGIDRIRSLSKKG